MGWRTVVVNSHSKLSYKNHHLVYKSIDTNELIHLSEIDILLLETTDITITTMLMSQLLEQKVLVIFCDGRRFPIGKVVSFYGRHDSGLQMTRQIEWEKNLKEKTWTTIIFQKIRNQSSLLAQCGYTDKACMLDSYMHELENMDMTNREGHSAKVYFNSLFGKSFNRQLLNDVNAALNYGYTLVLSVVARELVKCGCVTQLGLKHSNQFNEFNLASDMMEPFRPLVDKIVYTHQTRPFKQLKLALFDLFSNTYLYEEKNMYLTNIIEDYVKKTVAVLNSERECMPDFQNEL